VRTTMTEPAMRQRQAIDLDEFERRLRAAPPPSKAADDPLAELARLVGQDDPFKQVFAEQPPQAGGRGRVEPRVELVRPGKEPLAVADSRARSVRFAEAKATAGGPSRADAPPHWEREMASDPGSAPSDECRYGAPEPPAADDDSEAWPAPDGHLPPPSEQARPPARRSRRGFYAMVGIGGLALVTAAILYGFRGISVMSSVEPPTIRAATGPAKVLPAAQTGDDTATQQDASILDRDAADTRQVTKIVTREEQPVDLAQAPTQAASIAEPAAPNPTAPTMEPKKVKTVPVRPDGTIVTTDSAAPPIAPIAAPAMASVPPVAVTPAKPAEPSKSEAAPLPKSATPKTTVRAAATPKPAAAAGTNPTAALAMPARPKQMAKAAPPAPVSDAPEGAQTDAQTADNMPTGATPAATAGFAVQLAAPPSEQEARDLAARLQKKFANELSGYHPTIYRADAAGHQVYRVRVVNLSHDDAVSLCEKLKTGGGACFIAKN
jgi:hypothetical protein